MLKNLYFTKHLLAFLLLLLFAGCAPVKKEVTETDKKRLVHYITILRFRYNLEKPEPPSDTDIFMEACDKLRLDPALAAESLKNSHPQIYKLVKANDS